MLLNPLYIPKKFEIVTFKLNVTKYIPIKVNDVIAWLKLIFTYCNVTPEFPPEGNSVTCY